MTSSDDSNKALLTECEKEPIHIPGSIQPFGVLIAIEFDSLRIHNASQNCLEYWGVPAHQLVGTSFTELLLNDEVAAFRHYILHPNPKEQSFLPLTLTSDHGTTREAWKLSAHWHLDNFFLELEPVVVKVFQTVPAPFRHTLRETVQSLLHVHSVQQLCDYAVKEVRAITGFDRVMLYRFDPEFNGMVVSEAKSSAVDSYLNHHFPASDIPAQARAIFLQNWLRMIPDVDYSPSRLYPGTDPVTHAPLDLGQATLRSVSPIHLEYLRNMNVKATLTISLLDQGKLWGLIACHHEEPLLIDPEDRLGAQLVGQIVSSQIRVKGALEDSQYKAELKRVNAALLAFMQEDGDLVRGLVKHSPNLLDIAAAQGAAAAIYVDGDWTLIGKTPSIAQIDDLVTWLSDNHSNDSLFQTDSLCRLYPEAYDYREVASGLLAIWLPRTKRNYLLWFRPEVLTTITWAGNPEKSVHKNPDGMQLHPRTSFNSWKEAVTGKAIPWREVEIEAVEELQNSITALDLDRQFKKEQTARAAAERLSREKANIVAIVSHDLKTPLNSAHLVFELLLHSELSTEPSLKDLINKGINATREMEMLIVDLLDMVRIESGTLQLNDQIHDMAQLVVEIVDLTGPIAQDKGVRLVAVQAQTPCLVSCERGRIFQVLSNLVGNALKFTPPGGEVTVSVSGLETDIIFCVSDTGPGIPQENIGKIFDQFWQANEAKRFGTGLGLAIAKGIVEKHRGRIWIDSQVGVGTNFYFSLPRKSA